MIIDYDQKADSLLLIISGKPPYKDVSYGWNCILTFSIDDELVQIQLLNASA